MILAPLLFALTLHAGPAIPVQYPLMQKRATQVQEQRPHDDVQQRLNDIDSQVRALNERLRQQETAKSASPR